MQQITSDQVTTSIRALFRTDVPQSPRCFSVLDGTASSGKIIVDNLANPQWAIVQELLDYSIYIGGQIDPTSLTEVFGKLRQIGEVLFGMWDDDPHLMLMPNDPAYDGRTLEFYDRSIDVDLDAILSNMPAGCEIRRLDRALILRTEWGPNDVKSWGSLDVWEQNCFGYCLMRGTDILSEATVGPAALGLYEPGVFTQAAQRGKGYGTIVVARLIQEIEATDRRTYWNCAKQNIPSSAMARKLGYQVEKEYRCLVWSKTK